jgi:hypothetical protein
MIACVYEECYSWYQSLGMGSGTIMKIFIC